MIENGERTHSLARRACILNKTKQAVLLIIASFCRIAAMFEMALAGPVDHKP
jgi:hypothetical protein